MSQHRDPESAREAFYAHVGLAEPAPGERKATRISWTMALLAPALAGIVVVLIISSAAAPATPQFHGSPFIHPEARELGLVASVPQRKLS